MIEYLIKRKVKKEVEEKGKKVLIYTGAIATGVGIYFSYKMIKNRKAKKEIDNDTYYLNNEEYDLYEEEYNDNNEIKDSELEEKIDEFNSRRLNSEDSLHVPQIEIDSYIDSVEDTKDDIEIDKDDFKEDEYEKYEYIEEDLEKK